MLPVVAKEWKSVGSFGTVGLEIVLAIVLGLFGGRWLDTKFDTAPYLAVVGFFFGVITAVKAIHRTTKEMQREAAREEREEGNPAPLFDDKFGEKPLDPRPDFPADLPTDTRPSRPPSPDADR
jgi:hypothetical protein